MLLLLSSFRRLQGVFKTSSRHFGQYQYICLGHTSSKRLAKTSLQNIFHTSCQDASKTSCKNVLKTSSRRLQDILKTSRRRFQDIFKTFCKDVFKRFSRRIIKLNCFYTSSRCIRYVSERYCTVIYRKICLGHASEKFMVSQVLVLHIFYHKKVVT